MNDLNYRTQQEWEKKVKLGHYRQFMVRPRNKKILELVDGGRTQTSVAKEFNLSKGMIGIIVHKGRRLREMKAELDKRYAAQTPLTMETPIKDLELFMSVRLYRAFIQNGWTDWRVCDLANIEDNTLLRVPNLGRKALAEWRETVKKIEDRTFLYGKGKDD